MNPEEFDAELEAALEAGDRDEVERLYAIACEMIGGEPDEEVFSSENL